MDNIEKLEGRKSFGVESTVHVREAQRPPQDAEVVLALLRQHACLELRAVEAPGGEMGDEWVHPVLDAQHVHLREAQRDVAKLQVISPHRLLRQVMSFRPGF